MEVFTCDAAAPNDQCHEGDREIKTAMTIMQKPLDGPCVCGRDNIHCRLCGSAFVYAKAKAALRNNSGDIAAQGYHCRKCGVDFHALVPCNAPPPRSSGKAMLARGSADEVAAHLEGKVDKNLLERFREHFGVGRLSSASSNLETPKPGDPTYMDTFFSGPSTDREDEDNG